jgi:signal transduction histidine kinase
MKVLLPRLAYSIIPIPWLVQFGWLITFALVAGIYVTNLPHVYWDTAWEWQVRNAFPAALQIFSTRMAFVQWIIFLRHITLTIFVITSLFLAWRRFNDWFVLYVSASLLLMCLMFGSNFDPSIIRYPQWLDQSFPAIRIIAPSMMIMSMVYLFYLIPDGRFEPRWMFWLALPSTIVILLFFTASYFAPLDKLNWLFLSEDRGWIIFIGTLVITAIVGLIGQIIRYRRKSDLEQRQQTKWVLLGLSLLILGPIFDGVVIDLFMGRWVDTSLRHLISLHLSILLPTLLPVAIAFSIFRYRLWDVDLIINRTLVYGGLTLLVISAYIILVGLLGVLIQPEENIILSALVIGLIAILFHPLRQHMQKTINRFMYGDRDDPATVLSRLSERLASTTVPGETLSNVVEIIAQTLKLPYVAIKQEDGERKDGGLTAEYGQRSEQVMAFPLVYQGRSIGKLLVSPRSSRETFTPNERRLLENIARQAGPAVSADHLTHHLQHSRQQLVTSREEERRRIRRDLHDGLGPQLATMNLKLDATRNYLPGDPDMADRMLQELKCQVQEAIQDIRRLVYDLRPPALDQLGLVPALREFAAQNSVNGLHISVDVPDTFPALPAAVEVAVYRIAQEAMTNAARHARANQCIVRVSAGDEICLEIIDNGEGLPAQLPSGVGLASIRERTAELGGIFSLISTPGAGTHLSIRLPLS